MRAVHLAVSACFISAVGALVIPDVMPDKIARKSARFREFREVAGSHVEKWISEAQSAAHPQGGGLHYATRPTD